MKLIKILTLATATMGSIACGTGDDGPQPQRQPLLIAHAGGGIDNETYCNCKEALDYAYEDRGLRHFELDFHWTSDGKLVLVHDWERTYKKWFGQQAIEGEAPSLEQFVSFRMKNDRTQLTLADLAEWLKKHSDAVIVTDIKRNNLQALRLIAAIYPRLQKQFIPQIYQLDEYPSVADLGYSKVILTLYRIRASDAEVVEFAKAHPLFAVTVWHKKLESGSLTEDLSAIDVPVFVHTLNYWHQALPFWRRGVSGIYTDFLHSSDAAALDAAQVKILGSVKGGEKKSAAVDLAGSDRLVLFVSALGNKSDDHADWCDVTLERATGEKVPLTDAQLVDTRQGWGKLTRNKSVDGNNLRIGGYECETGWGTHAPSELTFDLGRNSYKSLSFGYGIDSEVGEKGNAQFGVLLLPRSESKN